MKILLISDVHGDFAKMERIMEENSDCDKSIFLGDFQTDIYVEQELASRFDYVIRGNNDNYGISENNLLIELDGVKIFMTHGDKYFSMFSYVDKDKLAVDAKLNGATLALHGHDHKSSISEHNGVTVFNPGSPSYPRFGAGKTYGIIEIENGVITRIENIPC